MKHLPHVDSARRFSSDTADLHRTMRLASAALAIGFGLAVGCSGAIAQNAAKGSPDHIKAVTSAVDGASIKANTATSSDWPTIGLDYAETRFSKLNQINTDKRQEARSGVELSAGVLARRRSDACGGRWHHVPDGLMERGARHRRPHRQADLELRSRRRSREGLQRLL